MAQVLEQTEQKPLTLEQISPEWNPVVERVIAGGKMTNAERYALGDGEVCIVGEAYGFDATYFHDERCMACIWYSERFFNPYHYAERPATDSEYRYNWPVLKTQFEQHWNEKHLKIDKNKKNHK
jgi:hypothetical protein